MIIHSNLAEMKNKTLPTCLEGKYKDSLGEFGEFGADCEGVSGCTPKMINLVSRNCFLSVAMGRGDFYNEYTSSSNRP